MDPVCWPARCPCIEAPVIQHLDLYALIRRIAFERSVQSDSVVPGLSLNSSRRTKLAYSFSVKRFPPPSEGHTIRFPSTTYPGPTPPTSFHPFRFLPLKSGVNPGSACPKADATAAASTAAQMKVHNVRRRRSITPP